MTRSNQFILILFHFYVSNTCRKSHDSDVRIMRETYYIIWQDYLYGPTMIPISWSCLYALYYLKNLPTLKLE